MNYVEITYLHLLLLIIKIHSCVTQLTDPLVLEDSMLYENVIDVREKLDESEFQIQVEQAIIDEIQGEWKSCLASNRPRTKCNTLYESMLRKEKPLLRMKHYHAMLEEQPHVFKNCRKAGRLKQQCILEKRDRENRISVMGHELYPWKEIYEMCIAALQSDKCYQLFDQLQIRRYRNLVPESLITLAKAHICLDVGRSQEDCEIEAMEHYSRVVEKRDEL